MRKEIKGWWPKLICHPQKPAWLKIDFDRWQSEDDVEEIVRDVTQDYPGLYNKVFEEEYGYRKGTSDLVYSYYSELRLLKERINFFRYQQ